ncbi:MAG: hypothetical protein ACOVRN_00565, partial [Flavobacterium sp.]
MENTTNEFVKLFRERLKYPIITVYSIILVIYNWDVLAIFFFSNKKIEDRIIYINTVFKGQTFERFSLPLLKAIVVSLLAPSIMWGLDFVLNKINFKRQEIRNRKNQYAWKAKADLAKYEFEYEQARTGKRDIESWENKLNEVEEARRLEVLAAGDMLSSLNSQLASKDLLIETLEKNNKEIERKFSETISFY